VSLERSQRLERAEDHLLAELGRDDRHRAVAEVELPEHRPPLSSENRAMPPSTGTVFAGAARSAAMSEGTTVV